MKIFALGLAAVLVSTVAAQAGDPLAVGYGNTVTQTMPDGSKMVVYVNADKTWEQHMGNGMVMKGTFTEPDDTHACFTMTSPPPKDASKATNCMEIKGGHNVGDTWTETLPDGKNTMTVSITAGR